MCGGKGTRFGNLTKKIPKPMLEVNKKPILQHIIEIYIRYNIKTFIILVGYKSKVIHDYFKKKKIKEIQNGFFLLRINNKIIKLKILNTGLNTMKKKRILLAKKYINTKNFFLTYGDGLGNIDIKDSFRKHKSYKSLITITAVRPPSRFGELILQKNKVISFNEKHSMSRGFINGGFMVCNEEIFKYFNKSKTDFEDSVIDFLAKKKRVYCHKHLGFWQCADNERELKLLNSKYKTINK